MLKNFYTGENLDTREIFRRFFISEELYSGIPDFLYCISAAFMVGEVESLVESMGSKLEIHNRASRGT